MLVCPICGKSENRKGESFTDRSEVVGHVDGCHDEQHSDVDGETVVPETVSPPSPASGGGSHSGLFTLLLAIGVTIAVAALGGDRGREYAGLESF